MNEKALQGKLPTGFHKRRKRRNSKYQRCKAAIKEQMNLSTEASELAMFATRVNRVELLRPFNQNFNREEYQKSVEKENQEYQRPIRTEDGMRRLHTEESLYRSQDRRTTSPRLSIRQINCRLGRIINPEEEYTTETKHQISINPYRQYQQAIIDQHIHEFSKAKEEEFAFRRRISTRFAEKYPHRVNTEPDLTADFSHKKVDDIARKTLVTPRNIDSRNSNGGKRWTFFYSRSKKRCFMQRYVPQQTVTEEKEKAPTLSFMGYLWSKEVRKSLTSQVSRKSRCENLARSKQRILEMQKPGSKRQLDLRECLDKILLDNKLN